MWDYIIDYVIEFSVKHNALLWHPDADYGDWQMQACKDNHSIPRVWLLTGNVSRCYFSSIKIPLNYLLRHTYNFAWRRISIFFFNLLFNDVYTAIYSAVLNSYTKQMCWPSTGFINKNNWKCMAKHIVVWLIHCPDDRAHAWMSFTYLKRLVSVSVVALI